MAYILKYNTIPSIFLQKYFIIGIITNTKKMAKVPSSESFQTPI